MFDDEADVWTLHLCRKFEKNKQAIYKPTLNTPLVKVSWEMKYLQF